MTSAASHDAVIVLTTIDAADRADMLARTLVSEGLAACVNVLPPMQSIYRWKGEVTGDVEHQLVVKTTERRLEALRARLHQLHPYELPEFLVIRVSSGSPSYLAWLAESTSAD